MMVVRLAVALYTGLSLLITCGAADVRVSKATDEQIRTISSEIWAADAGRLTGSDVQYNPSGPQLFTYVDESKLVGTYSAMTVMFNNYIAQTGTGESCQGTCVTEQSSFINSIYLTQPIALLHNWLVVEGLASVFESEFKNQLRQYWFMKYTRSNGPLDSSGFEHVFVGEIKNNAVSGSTHWVRWYLQEKAGNFSYGAQQALCSPEILKFDYTWSGYSDPSMSMFIRTSPEVEIALYTLCLLARPGTSCPLLLDGNQLTMTVAGMPGYPTTVGSAIPNC